MSDNGLPQWPEGVARHILERVDSTNAEALRLASSLSGPTWILAHKQEAGRGRRGRAWTDPPGNFAASFVFHPQQGPAEAARYSFVAALALQDALVQLCGPMVNVALKWPNDVLLNGGKLSGILLESAGSGGQVNVLVIGIGVNLVSAPEQAQLETHAVRPVSLLQETGFRVTAEEFLDALAPAFDHWHRQMRDRGFVPIQQAWMTRAARLGEVIVARTGTIETTGTFEGIDETGALILITSQGRQAIPAADIHFSGG